MFQKAKVLSDSLKRPEYCFLSLAALFGVLLVFLTPPLQSPDEGAHFFRAYQVSELHISPVRFETDNQVQYGANLPNSLYTANSVFMGDVAFNPLNKFPHSVYKDYIFQPLDPSKRENLVTSGAMYSPTSYAPQALGIAVGRALHASPMLLIWLGRLCNLAFWILVVFFSIRFIPFAKWVIVILALNPMMVFLSASLSTDVMNVSMSILFVSVLLMTLSKKPVIRDKRIVLAVLGGVLCILALTKPVNILFAALLTLMPLSYFKDRKKKILYIILVTFVAVSLWALWNYHVRGAIDWVVQSQSGGRHVNAHEQASYILHHPLAYLYDIVKNFILVSPSTPGVTGNFTFLSYAGNFGWLDTPLPTWIIVAYFVAVAFTILWEQGASSVTLNTWRRGVLLAIAALLAAANITAMYTNASVVGSDLITGVQGRYFIPAGIILGVALIARKRVIVKGLEIYKVIFPVMLSILLVTVVIIGKRYY